MRYEVVLSPVAEEDFRGLPPPIQNLVEAHLRRLADSPTSLSRTSVFPYPPAAQLSDLWDETVYDDTRHYIAILFRFSQDEKSLQIIGIGVNPPYES